MAQENGEVRGDLRNLITEETFRTRKVKAMSQHIKEDFILELEAQTHATFGGVRPLDVLLAPTALSN